MQSETKTVEFGVGWLNEKKDGTQYISARSSGERQAVKLLVEDVNTGEQVTVSSFAVFFNNNKTNEKAPDVSFRFTPES